MASERRTCAAIAAFAALALAAASRAETPDPELPPGWILQELALTDGQILRPESWSYREEQNPFGVLWTFAEQPKPDGTYLTGMRIQLIAFSEEEREQKTPEQLAGELHAKFEREAERVVSTCGPEVRGDFTNRCIEVIQRFPGLLPGEPFHVVYGLWWSRGYLVVSTFGTPESEWTDRQETYAAMANFRLIGPGFGKRAEVDESERHDSAPTQSQSSASEAVAP